MKRSVIIILTAALLCVIVTVLLLFPKRQDGEQRPGETYIGGVVAWTAYDADITEPTVDEDGNKRRQAILDEILAKKPSDFSAKADVFYSDPGPVTAKSFHSERYVFEAEKVGVGNDAYYVMQCLDVLNPDAGFVPICRDENCTHSDFQCPAVGIGFNETLDSSDGEKTVLYTVTQLALCKIDGVSVATFSSIDHNECAIFEINIDTGERRLVARGHRFSQILAYYNGTLYVSSNEDDPKEGTSILYMVDTDSGEITGTYVPSKGDAPGLTFVGIYDGKMYFYPGYMTNERSWTLKRANPDFSDVEAFAVYKIPDEDYKEGDIWHRFKMNECFAYIGYGLDDGLYAEMNSSESMVSEKEEITYLDKKYYALDTEEDEMIGVRKIPSRPSASYDGYVQYTVDADMRIISKDASTGKTKVVDDFSDKGFEIDYITVWDEDTLFLHGTVTDPKQSGLPSMSEGTFVMFVLYDIESGELTYLYERDNYRSFRQNVSS